MNKSILEIVFLAICFLVIIVASVLSYNGSYSQSLKLLGITLITLFIYIIFKFLKKVS